MEQKFYPILSIFILPERPSLCWMAPPSQVWTLFGRMFCTTLKLKNKNYHMVTLDPRVPRWFRKEEWTPEEDWETFGKHMMNGAS